MDFISLWVSAYITHSPKRVFRMSLSAAVGGIFGIFSVILSLEGIISFFACIAVSVLMSIIAFGYESFAATAKKSALLWGTGALLGGIMTALLSLFSKADSALFTDNYIAVSSFEKYAVLVVCSVAVLIIFVKNTVKSKNVFWVEISVKFGEKETRFPALCDSGNLLFDPLGGESVCVVSKEALYEVLDKKVVDAMVNFDTDMLKSFGGKIRVIPRKTADKNSMCIAILPDKTVIYNMEKNTKKEVILLFAPLNVPKKYFGGKDASFSPQVL